MLGVIYVSTCHHIIGVAPWSPLLALSSTTFMTLNQRKSTQKSNDNSQMPPKAKDHTLQQYADTDGHFSLVRFVEIVSCAAERNAHHGSDL